MGESIGSNTLHSMGDSEGLKAVKMISQAYGHLPKQPKPKIESRADQTAPDQKVVPVFNVEPFNDLLDSPLDSEL